MAFGFVTGLSGRPSWNPIAVYIRTTAPDSTSRFCFRRIKKASKHLDGNRIRWSWCTAGFIFLYLLSCLIIPVKVKIWNWIKKKKKFGRKGNDSVGLISHLSVYGTREGFLKVFFSGGALRADGFVLHRGSTTKITGTYTCCPTWPGWGNGETWRIAT